MDGNKDPWGRVKYDIAYKATTVIIFVIAACVVAAIFIVVGIIVYFVKYA
jgi:hypothetical protein